MQTHGKITPLYIHTHDNYCPVLRILLLFGLLCWQTQVQAEENHFSAFPLHQIQQRLKGRLKMLFWGHIEGSSAAVLFRKELVYFKGKMALKMALFLFSTQVCALSL